jgi:NADH:quinone reductase (non-electrogenic)
LKTTMGSPDATGRPRVIVVGGGFGGVEVVRALQGASVSITLVDRHNYHLFQPLLYQVATAELDPANIAAPLRRLFRGQENVEVALAEIRRVDLKRKVVAGPRAEVGYDYLVLATGATQSYFGHDEFQPFAPGLKTLDDAVEIRRRVLLAFEEAEWEADDEARRAKLTFIVVGGGPTGVELAGAIMDTASRSLPEDFRFVNTRTARVMLVEGSGRLLKAMPEAMSARAHRDLNGMGIEVRLNTRVTSVDATGVAIGEARVPAENVFWAAGVRGHPVAATLGVALDRAGRVIVGPDMTIPGHPEAFVIGDAAHAVDARTGDAVPGVAQGAVQGGKFVAESIRMRIQGARPDSTRAFTYKDKGSMATIGRGKAVVSIGRIHFGGLLGWLAWGGLHAALLVGFQSRLFVLLSWMRNYFFADRRVRLITGDASLRAKEVRGATLLQKQPKADDDRGERAGQGDVP